jgi:hypothetical protein
MQRISGTEFSQGQHICAVYETAEEQCAVAAAFITDGLHRRECCLYVAESDSALDRFRLQLAACGMDAFTAERSGALLLLTSGHAHLADGRFDPERMLRMLNDAVEQALNDGFAGLRTCGDMSWLLADAPGTDQVTEYEAVLNQFFRNVRGLGMCQYDRLRLPDGLLDKACFRAHATVVAGGTHRNNPLFVAE